MFDVVYFISIKNSSVLINVFVVFVMVIVLNMFVVFFLWIVCGCLLFMCFCFDGLRYSCWFCMDLGGWYVGFVMV